MTPVPLSLRLWSVPYSVDIARYLDAGLKGEGAPTALSCDIQEGRHPRLTDFAAWRKLGEGSHQTTGIISEPTAIREALSAAAFLIGDSGGFLGALPRDSLKRPAYLFTTHGLIAWDRSFSSGGRLGTAQVTALSHSLHIAQTRGVSGHGGMIALEQIQAIVDTLFFLEDDKKLLLHTSS